MAVKLMGSIKLDFGNCCICWHSGATVFHISNMYSGFQLLLQIARCLIPSIVVWLPTSYFWKAPWENSLCYCMENHRIGDSLSAFFPVRTL